MIKRNLWLKPAVFLAALGPLARLGWKGLTGDLGANPIQLITLSTGTWTLVFLLITLSITPLRRISGQNGLIQYRRMVGLFAFFYGVLHFLTYIWLDQFFDLPGIVKDVYKRPFITAGFTGFVLLVPLAITSTKAWIRRLGKRWQALHRAIYFAAACGVIHYYWKVKSDVRMPLYYGALVGILLLWRLGDWFFKRRSAAGAKLSPQHVPTSPAR